MTFFALAAKYREYIAKCVPLSYPKFFMRISLLLFFSTTILSNLLAATLVSAQQIDKVQVTIELKNETLTDAIHKIEKQTSFTFLYRNDDVANVRALNVKNSKITLSVLLNKLLSGTALTFKQVDQRIIIDRAPQKQQTNTDNYDENFYAKQLTDSTFLLKGRVTEEKTGQTLVGAGVSSADKQTVTDADGYFKIPVTVGNKLIVSYMGFQTVEILIENSTTNNLEIKMGKGGKKSIELAEVNIEWDKVKASPTKFVNLENRQYMNLSQILQGTIPGLSLQIVSTSTKTVTSIDAYVNRYYGQVYGQFKRFTVDEFLNYFGRTQGQNIIDQLLKGTNVPSSISSFYHINTTTTITSSLVPEIRGANNFGGANISNMLVVIDGFPQDGFPANYPMTNVESIEVIKDPKELIKWGPRAAGGAIIIKSKAAKAGNLQFNYTASFYYAKAPKFNRERLKLADSRTYLNYLKEVDSIGGTTYGNTQFGLSPAKQLLSQRKRNVITTEQFNAQWDSLARLNNDAQLNLLQQNLFNQTHSLTVSGGSQAYKFTAIGNYTDGQTNDLNSKNNSYGFSLNNTFNLLKDKLHIRWLINYSDTKSRTGYSFNPTNAGLDPYQMLLDGQGNYVYDDTALSATGNQLIQSRGYKNYGVNILQDARVNKNTSNMVNKQSNFNMNWNLLPGVNWISSVIYSHRNTETDQLYGAESSYARQFVDTYGQLTSNGVNFYVPYGDIYKPGRSVNDDWNVRSALTYSKVFGKHAINVGVGAGAASLTISSPAYNTLYGYNATTKTSTPIYLPTNPSTQATINNFYALFPNSSSSAYPSSLTQKNMGDTAIVRNVNANASVDYSYADRIKVSGLYTQAYSPLYGQAATYSTQSSYNGDVTGSILKNGGKFVKNVLLSVGLQGIKMPDLPAQYSNTRYLQTYWNNYTIWVNGATPTQQQGQSSKLLYQRLTLALADSTIVLNGAYNTQTIKGDLVSLNSSSAATNTTQTVKYLSSGLDFFLRKKLLNLHAVYSKSPEGQSQYNGSFNYNIARESYFKSNTITMLEFNAILQEISPYQGLGLMQSTNIVSNGSFSQATNTNFGLLPAQNQTFEAHGKIGFGDNRINLDLRYYNQTSSGLTNNIKVLTDPSTGLSNQTTYSSITNKGVEFYFNVALIKTPDFGYSVTINGARNSNIARNVPVTPFTATSDYPFAYRNGYDVSNVWAPRWAGLNAEGDPQIYDKDGKVTSVLDSATIAGAMKKQGVTKAPWTGGLIQEVRLQQFFARVAMTFNFGAVMRDYRPYPGSDTETSALVADRWRKPGDELTTDIPRITTGGANTYREFVTRYSSNSIISADNVRLSEVMVGFNLPNQYLKKYGLGTFTMTFQVQNIAYWARNKYHLDPSVVSFDGRIGNPLPKIYSCNISLNF